MKSRIACFKRINYTLGLIALVLLCVSWFAVPNALAAEHAERSGALEAGAEHGASAAADRCNAMSYAFIAAAIATGLGSIAAGIAVATVGSAAMAAVAERPELMGKSLIYVALAEGIAIYGLLISIIILAKV